MKKRTVISELKNKEMNQAVYAQRRKVMEIIYELKKYLELPRIEVRITENPQDNVIGMGTMCEAVTIWITERATEFPYESLRHLVAHEIGHAVFKLNHSGKCPLMKQGLSRVSPASLETIVSVLSKASKRRARKKNQPELMMRVA